MDQMDQMDQMNISYPLKLTPVFKETIWGGERLKAEFNKQSSLERIAESWELTCRSDAMNLIASGNLAGRELSAFVDNTKRFPLLVKLIDANDKLSIQVHPDDAYASLHESGDTGKTEAWYIVDAKPSAKIIYGIRGEYDRESFKAAALSGELEDLLNYVEVKKGDLFFIPSGMVHAIGDGILIAEVQQSSDLTYRVYDYNRTDKSGMRRKLHLEKALDVIRTYSEDEIDALRFSRGRGDGNLLVNCDYFSLKRICSDTVADASDGFVHLLCLSGEGNADGVRFKKGDSLFLAAGSGRHEICGDGDFEMLSIQGRIGS